MHPNPHIRKIREHVVKNCVMDHDQCTWDAIEINTHPRVLENVAAKIHLWDKPDPPGSAGLHQLYRQCN
jgi:hypothetical protein